MPSKSKEIIDPFQHIPNVINRLKMCNSTLWSCDVSFSRLLNGFFLLTYQGEERGREIQDHFDKVDVEISNSPKICRILTYFFPAVQLKKVGINSANFFGLYEISTTTL